MRVRQPQHFFRSTPWLNCFISLWTCVALCGLDSAALGAGLVMSGDTLVDLDFGVSQTVTGPLSGTGTLVETGAGILRLVDAGTSTFTGDFAINGGVLVVSGAGQLGAASNNVYVAGANNNNSLFYGGQLVVDGGTSGITIAQDISLAGKGSMAPNGGASLLSIGNATYSVALLTGASVTETYLDFAYGNTTLAGPVQIATPGNRTYFGGAGNVIVTGLISGFEAANQKFVKGTGILSSSLWLQNTNNTFLSSISLTGGFLRVSDGRALGKNPSLKIDFSSGVLDIHADADTLPSFSGVNVSLGNGIPIFADRAIGGSGLSQTVTLGTIADYGQNTVTINGRNGYSVTMGSSGATLLSSGGVFVKNYSNNSGGNGLLTLLGNIRLGNSTAAFNAQSDITQGFLF